MSQEGLRELNDLGNVRWYQIQAPLLFSLFLTFFDICCRTSYSMPSSLGHSILRLSSRSIPFSVKFMFNKSPSPVWKLSRIIGHSAAGVEQNGLWKSSRRRTMSPTGHLKQRTSFLVVTRWVVPQGQPSSSYHNTLRVRRTGLKGEPRVFTDLSTVDRGLQSCQVVPSSREYHVGQS
jgi:hypothetical protein